MSALEHLAEPCRVNEPHAVPEYSAVLTQVAADGRPIIVQRDGEDLAAVIPVTLLEEVRELFARQQLEEKAARIHWDQRTRSRPPQTWFNADENPFVPEDGLSP